MDNKSDEKFQIRRETDAANRIKALNKHGLVAAILSIENVDELERLAKIGEDYMKTLSVSRKK